MTDEAPAIEQDQPNPTEAPETDQPTGGEESFTDSYNPNEVPEELRPQLEAAYKQLQSAYTKKTQEFSSGRQEAEQNAELIAALNNPQTRAAVLQRFGVELVDENDEPDEFATDEPDLYSEVEQLKQWKAEQIANAEAAQAEEAVLDYVSEEIARLEESNGREFDAEDHRIIDGLAKAFTRQDGTPDVQKAFELLSGYGKREANAILESKKAPRRPGAGLPASQAADLTNPEVRRARMAEAADAARASQE